jgi:hypothetical protein
MSDAPLALKGDAGSKASKAVTFTPTNFAEAVQFAKLLSTTDLVPKDYRGKSANILVAMQMGAEVGLAPMQALQSIAVINGKPSVYGDAALAIVQAHPNYENHKEWFTGEGDKKTAFCEIKRRGQEASVQKWSVEDAKKANLWGKDGPWKQYPDRMLQMRARGFALRDRFADALRGMILVEEAGDYTHTNIRPGDIERASLGGTPLNTQQQLGKLSVSSEPNRGHGNEGTERQKEPEKSMCAECRQVNGHAADCPQAKKAVGKKPTSRERWEKSEGHDPKIHISFDEGLQLFNVQKDLKISEEDMKAFLDREFKIQHRYQIRQDQFQNVLGKMAEDYGKNLDAEDPEDEPEPVEDTPRNTTADGLFDEPSGNTQSGKRHKDPS